MKLQLKPRPEDGHKGTFGHAMIVAGKYGMAGASVLAVKSCLRSGVGKVTMHIPQKNNDIVQIAVPEAIIEHDNNCSVFSSTCNLAGINAIAIGPGLGTDPVSADALHRQLIEIGNGFQHGVSSNNNGIPTVLDADALNILSQHSEWLDELPQDTIITPHVGELRRLAESISLSSSDIPFTKETFDSKACAKYFADKYHCHVVMKGHPTVVFHPDNTAYTCNFGNDGMATAGSGDVLTGIIVALLAQGYDCKEASEIGVTLHALAGDAAAQDLGHHCLIASDLIAYLPKAFEQI